MVQSWITGNNGSVLAVAPARKGAPLPSDLAILVPRPEDSPVTLALYLSSAAPFAILVPNDLLESAFSIRIFLGANPVTLREQFQAAGKLQILATQMTWVVGNMPEYRSLEMFSQRLRTPAPITGVQDIGLASTFEDPVPHVVEDWIHEQARDPDFIKSLESMENVACRNGLYLYAPDGQTPKILVPKVAREPLI